MKDFNRPEFSQLDLEIIIEASCSRIVSRLNQKGYKHIASDFECMGLLDQELYEYRRAIHERSHNWARVEELLDISWAALLGVIMHNTILDKQETDEPESFLL